MSEHIRHVCAQCGYDDEFHRQLLFAITKTVLEESRIGGRMALRVSETVDALSALLAVILSFEPATGTPDRLHTMTEMIAARLRHDVERVHARRAETAGGSA